MTKKRLLLIEDDYDVAEMLLIYFGSQEFEVIHEDTGGKGINSARLRFPHLILLDLMLPDMDGYEVCHRLRQTSFTKYIPIIFLTQRDERANKVRGLELGADDYITKPFDIDELRLRVQGSINRATRESLHEPRTGLPTGQLVDEEIVQRQNRTAPFTAFCLTLEGFRTYSDVYGFMAANEVMGHAARVIQQVVSQRGTPNDFVGIVDDQFVVLTSADEITALEAELRHRVNEAVHAFYNFHDVEQGGTILHEGTPDELFVPLMFLKRC